MSIDVKTAVYGTAAKINDEMFAKALKRFIAQGIDIAAGIEKQVRALNNFNMTLHDKKESNKSIEVDSENNKKPTRR